MEAEHIQEMSDAKRRGVADREIAIKVIGIGGAGSNAVDRLKMEDLCSVHLAVVNTDGQALTSSPVEQKCMIGTGVTRGLGTGGDPEVGRAAAEADASEIQKIVSGTDLVFLLSGMGGGTGSGASPVVARIAEEAGALVIAFVTLPFTFEGGRRQKQAEEGLAALRKSCSAVIPLPNDILMQDPEDGSSVLDAFSKADEWIARAVKSVWAMLFRTGLINLDYASLSQVFSTKGGKTLFGLGSGSGDKAVESVLKDLFLCPLLHTPEFSRKADRLLVNIIGGPDLGIGHVNEIMNTVTERFGRDAHVAMGAVIDESMRQSVEICVLGTTDINSRPRGVGSYGKQEHVRSVPAAGVARTPEASPAPPSQSAPGKAQQKGRQGVRKSTVPQEEFPFDELEIKGYFDRSEVNVFDGEDLDTPTYLRRGIRISL